MYSVTLILDEFTTTNIFSVKIRHSKSLATPCIIQISCRECDDDKASDKKCYSELKLIDSYDFLNKTLFGTKLEYRCPLGDEFNLTDGTVSLPFFMECNWNETWSPQNFLPVCIRKLFRNFF